MSVPFTGSVTGAVLDNSALVTRQGRGHSAVISSFGAKMADDRQDSNSTTPQRSSSSSSSSSSTVGSSRSSSEFSGHKARYPNPPESSIPDPVALREQWKFAIRQYSRCYSQAWGTAILAGVSFFALGWIIKGGNPLPSLQDISAKPSTQSLPPPSGDDNKETS